MVLVRDQCTLSQERLHGQVGCPHWPENVTAKSAAGGDDKQHQQVFCFLGPRNMHIVHNVWLVVFSACGGIRTACYVVLTTYVPTLSLGILGKGALFVTQPLQQCIYNCFAWADMSVTNRILAIKAKKRCCCYSVGQMCALSVHNKKMILGLLDLFQKLLTSFWIIFIGLKIKWRQQEPMENITPCQTINSLG